MKITIEFSNEGGTFLMNGKKYKDLSLDEKIIYNKFLIYAKTIKTN